MDEVEKWKRRSALDVAVNAELVKQIVQLRAVLLDLARITPNRARCWCGVGVPVALCRDRFYCVAARDALAATDPKKSSEIPATPPCDSAGVG